ncbi:hypothetical protein ACS0PU_010275 [Formica fusca]
MQAAAAAANRFTGTAGPIGTTNVVGGQEGGTAAQQAQPSAPSPGVNLSRERRLEDNQVPNQVLKAQWLYRLKLGLQNLHPILKNVDLFNSSWCYFYIHINANAAKV